MSLRLISHIVLLHGASIIPGTGAWNPVEREGRSSNWIDCKIVFWKRDFNSILTMASRMKSRSYDNTFPNSRGHLLQTQFLFRRLCCPSFYLISIAPRPKTLVQTLWQPPSHNERTCCKKRMMNYMNYWSIVKPVNWKMKLVDCDELSRSWKLPWTVCSHFPKLNFPILRRFLEQNLTK